jgi:hypothetical protein
MNRLPMSKAGAALLRALLSRALVEPDRILLTDYRSSDWQSLTFVGERHEMRFRVPGPDAQKTYDAMTGNLAEDEFALRGRFWPTSPCSDCPRTRRTARSASDWRR